MLTFPPSRRLPIVALLALLALLALTGVAGAAGSATAATDDSPGVDLNVDVLGPTGTPAPAAPISSPRPTSAPPKKTASVRGVTQTTAANPAEATHALGTDPTDIDGVFYVSGVTVSPTGDIGPGGGSIDLAFTLRNVTTAPITSSLRFWVTNALGMQVASVDDVQVADLAPGETRTVTATLRDVGQWAVFTGHTMLTPPAEVRATALGPVARESLVIVPPYFLLLVSAVVGGLALAVRFVPRPHRGGKLATVAGAES